MTQFLEMIKGNIKKLRWTHNKPTDNKLTVYKIIKSLEKKKMS